MPTLEGSFLGIPFVNPFFLSSAPPTHSREMIERAFAAGWGGAVIKTLAQNEPNGNPGNVHPRIQAIRSHEKILGFTNIELGTQRNREEWYEDIRAIKKKYPDRVLLASILYGGAPIEAQWREAAARCQEAGADGLELNFSCPHGQSESGGLSEIGTQPGSVLKIAGWVRESTTLPIMAKLPAFGNIVASAQAAKAAGINGISAINTINSIPGINLDTQKPLLCVDSQSALGGMSGRAIKPIALRCVAQIVRHTGLPVSGIGGIYSWEDAAEFLLLGAGSVQICSAVMEHGYGIIDSLQQGLQSYLRVKGMSLASLIGASLPAFVSHAQLNRAYRVYPVFDPQSCTHCGRCSVSCRDSGYQALHAEKSAPPTFNREACDSCGLCAQICPNRAIAMEGE